MLLWQSVHVMLLLQDSTELRVAEEASDHTVQFTLMRQGGTYGRVAVSWVASADFDLTADISPTNGMVSTLDE